MRPACEWFGCVAQAVGISDVDGDDYWLCGEHIYPVPS